MDAATWRRLAGSADFWGLVERKILTVSSPQRGTVRLSGGCYVGRADIDGVSLELREKVPGALTSLLRHLGHGALRTERIASPLSDLNDLARFLVREFLTAVRAYIGRGRERRYVSEAHVGSLISGRLDVTRTLRLRARGLPHLVAFDRDELVFDTPLNRVVYAALVEAERLDQALNLSMRDLAMARALSVAFADCRDAEILKVRREFIVQYAEDVAEHTEDERRRDLAVLAGIVLSHESFSATDPSARLAPRAWFLNLEKLFESAVRSVMARKLAALPEPGELWKRELLTKRVFPSVAGEFEANPDLVFSIGGDVTVGDAKYKEWKGTAGASDLYQLLTHAATYGAEQCFLVYPHDAFQARSLGRSTTGCDTWLFTLDIRDVEGGTGRIVEKLNNPPPVSVVPPTQGSPSNGTPAG